VTISPGFNPELGAKAAARKATPKSDFNIAMFSERLSALIS
jgi:hypothetical protein